MTDKAAYAVFSADGLYLIAGAEPGASVSPDQCCSPLQAAVALAALEPLLQYCDHWLGTPLDWRPAPAPPRPVDLTLVDTTRDCRAGLLLCDELVGRLPAAPAAFDGLVEWHWRHAASRLELATLSLGERDRRALGPGSLMLLPGSYAPLWSMRLYALEYQAAPFHTVFDVATGVLRVASSCEMATAASGDPAALSLSISLADSLPRPLRDRYRRPSAGATLGSLCLPGSRVHLLSDSALPCPAGGALMRFGRGFAVLVDTTH